MVACPCSWEHHREPPRPQAGARATTRGRALLDVAARFPGRSTTHIGARPRAVCAPGAAPDSEPATELGLGVSGRQDPDATDGFRSGPFRHLGFPSELNRNGDILRPNRTAEAEMSALDT